MFKDPITEKIDPRQKSRDYITLGDSKVPSFLIELAIHQYRVGNIEDSNNSLQILEQFYGLQIK